MMNIDIASSRRAWSSISLLFLCLIGTASCGLAMDNEDVLIRAAESYANGDYRASIIDTKSVLLDEPDNADARELLGRASVEIGDGASAEKELRRAVELGTEWSTIAADLGRALILQEKYEDVLAEFKIDNITDSELRGAMHRLRGDALIALYRPAEARTEFGLALELDSDDIEAQLGVVRSYIGERNYLQARNTLDQVIELDDAYVPSRLASGSLSLALRDSQRAISEYKVAVDLANQAGQVSMELEALFGLAEAYFVGEDLEPVRAILSRMQEISAEDIRTEFVASRVAMVDEEWITAQEILQGILQDDPEQRFAQYLLGIVQKERGNLTQAEMYLTAVVAASPNNAGARRVLAEVRMQLERADEAWADLESIVSSPNVDARSLGLAADANLMLGDVERAASLLEKAVAESPDDFVLKLQLALAYLRAGRPQDAQSLLESVGNPDGSDAQFQQNQLIIISVMAQGEEESAIELARSFVSQWPERIEALSLLGSILLSAGEHEEARKNLDRAIEIDPDNISTLKILAQLDEAQENIGGAIRRLSRVLELQANDVRAMVSLARLYSKSERYDDAVSWLEKAREADESALVPRLVLGRVYVDIGDWDKSIEIAKEAIEISPDNARAHGILGQSYLGRSDFVQASREYTQAAKLDPANATYTLNLAKSQALSGDRESALRTLEANPELSLSHIPSAVALSNLKAQLGDMQAAVKIAERLKTEHPQDATVRSLEAELELQKGNGGRAVQIYDEVLGIERSPQHTRRAYQVRSRTGDEDPHSPLLDFLDERPLDTEMRNYLARAYERSGEREEAVAQYEVVVKQDPNNLVALTNLALNYYELADERAESTARLAYDLRSDSPVVADTLGWILVNRGALEEGIKLLRNASDSLRDDPNIKFHLASALVAAGETAEGKSILELILASNKDFRSREEAEALLNTL